MTAEAGRFAKGLAPLAELLRALGRAAREVADEEGAPPSCSHSMQTVPSFDATISLTS
jgi:hypothetical protein